MIEMREGDDGVLISLRETGVIQVLLDECHLNVGKEWYGELMDVVGEYMHKTFITHSNYIKLCVWQTWHLDILEDVISRVESLHTSVDFVEELVGNNKLYRRVFGVHLALALSKKYALERVLGLVRDVVLRRVRGDIELFGSVREILVGFVGVWGELVGVVEGVVEKFERLQRNG